MKIFAPNTSGDMIETCHGDWMRVSIAKSLQEQIRLRDKCIAQMHQDRRERIATAAMNGILSNYVDEIEDWGVVGIADDAIRCADALIERLDDE